MSKKQLITQLNLTYHVYNRNSNRYVRACKVFNFIIKTIYSHK